MKTHAVNNVKKISTRFWTLLAAALLIVFSGSARAEVILFWNFDGFSTEGETNYITDTVHSERLNLVNASVVDGKLSANGGYAQGTVEGTNGVNVTLPTGSANYTLSAFLSTTKSGAVGIIAWGTNSNYHCNSFRTDNDGLKSYWWGSDLSVKGYPEIISGFENHVVTTGIGTNHYLYVNGQLIGTNSTHVRDEVNQNFTVGNTVNNNTETLVGTIDNASVYNDAMEHTDIITIAGSRFNGLTNWWKAGQNIDMIAGVVRPDSITGTTVLNGTNGDVMVFDRALESGEMAYYQGQLDASHAYVIDNMAGSEVGKTTWVRGTSANLSDAAQTPLGIYVGGTTDKPTLTATAQQLNAVNRTLVLGNGTLAVSSPSAFSLDLNRVDFDGGNVSIDASSNVTFNSNHLISVRNITSAAGSVLQFNGAGEIHVIGALSGTGNVVFSGDATTTLLSQSQGFTGTLTVQNGNTLVFTKQDTFNNAHNNSNVHVVADGGKITLTGAIYEYLTNVTLKNGAQIYAADGNTTWEAFKFRNLNVVRNSDGSAGAATTISGANNDHAVISFGPQSNQVATTPATIYVEDITSASGSSDSVSDLVITARIVNPTTVNNGTKTAGEIVKTGAGTLELKNGSNSFTGNLHINGGKVKVASGRSGNNSALGAVQSGRTIFVNSGAELIFASQDIFADAHTNIPVTIEVNGGKFSNTGAVYNFVQNVTLRNGANIYAADGNATWEAFKFQNLNVLRNSDGSAGTAVTLTAANKDHAVFTFGARSADITTVPATIYVEDITSASADTTDNAEDLVISAKIVEPTTNRNGTKTPAKIVKTGAGMLTLSNGANSFTGDFTINEGKVRITPKLSGSNSALGVVKAGRTITINSGGELILANQDIFTNAHNQNPLLFVLDGGTISNSGKNYDYLTNITFKNGGQLNATNGNDTWKAFKLHNVNVERSDRADRSPATITAVADQANATIAFGDRSDVINVRDNNSVSTVTVGEITSEDGSVDDLSDLIISAVIADPVHTTSGALKNATQIIKAGAGTMEWTAANTITGKTTISEGTLRLSAASTFGTGEVLINEDGTLEFRNSTATVPSAISGTGDILVSAGTATLTGAVNQTGGATTLANGTTLNVGSATLNDLAVTDETSSATLVASGNLTLNNDADTQFTGSITAASIEKTGTGTLRLNSGETGLINVPNLTVSGGRLDLKGNATGGITVGPNTVFSPGNSIGKAEVDGTFTLSSDTSSVLMEIGGSTEDENDLLIVSGDLALNNGKIYLELAENSTLNPGDDFIAVFHGNNSAALEDDFIANYVIAPDFMRLAYVQLDVGTYSGLYAITGEVFNDGAVPEPATWVMLLLGTFGLMYWRKK